MPDLNYVDTVYNGIDTRSFAAATEREDYLIVVGRMSPDKGIHMAIQVAQRSGRRLVLAGIVPTENQAYFKAKIQPYLQDGPVEFIGPVDHTQKNRWLSRAYASLHLVTYEEAFGLTMAESMACGMPVVAVRRGSVPELVEDGRTGFTVPADEEEAVVRSSVAALDRIGSLDRAYIRDYTRRRFDTEAMVTGYEMVYEKVVSSHTA